jgi:hypothetical protein
LGRLIVNFAGSKRKVPTISRETHAKVSYQNFDDEKKFASEKKWKLIMKVRRVQGVFFLKFGRNLIIFAAF